MATKFPEIFHELTEPFTDKQVKILPKGKGIQYVTARTVMNRLDRVLGPENWWDRYIPQPTCVICELTIQLPDGSMITKADAGGHAGMSDEGDDEKSGYSDAFKRAAVKFGVGRHLYGDGIPKFIDGPRTTPEFLEYLKAIDPTRKAGHIDFIKAWGKPKGYPDLISEWNDAQSREAYPVMARQVEATA